LALAALLPLCGSRALVAQTITVSGNPAALIVNAAIAGSEPISVSNSSTTYTAVTPLNPPKTYAVTAQLNANMPVGTTLNATFVAPPGGTSVGAVALDVTARNVVTGIPRNTDATQGITYQFVATAAAGVIPSTTRTVTLTILRFP